MAQTTNEYVRLPGKGFRRQSLFSVVRVTSRLYLGADHLLLADCSGGFEEDYRRLYYRDIQAVQVRRTSRGKHWNLFLGASILLTAGVSFLSSDAAWRGSWLAGAVFFLVVFLANVLRGPTCIAHIRTAVQVEELPSLRRLRAARRVLARLRPKIVEAQGTVDAGMLSGPAVGVAVADVGARRPKEGRARERSYRGEWHVALFTLLLVDAVHTGLHLVVQDLWLSLLGSLLWCGIVVSAVFALLRSQEASPPLALRVVTWAAVGYGFICLGISYVQQIVVSGQMQAEGGFAGQYQVLQRAAEMSPWDSPWLMAVELFVLAGSTLLGGAGALLTVRYARGRRVPPPLANLATADEAAAGPGSTSTG